MSPTTKAPKKTKYAVTFRGQTFTRTSPRVYTHMIVGRWNLEIDIARARAQRAQDLKNHAYYVRVLAEPKDKYWTVEQEQRAQAVAAMPTADAYADAELAERLAHIEQQRAEGRYDRFSDLGWCGRPDLADKAAASERSKGYYLDVTIVEVP